jgi:O-methyltransferase
MSEYKGIKDNLVSLFNGHITKLISAAICTSMSPLLGRKRDEYVYSQDIIRNSSLELVSHEVYEKEIKGNVAELGVARGEFAKNINKAFPDRKLYLFDTFEGHNENDIINDKKLNYISDSFSKKKSANTSIELVLSKMINKEMCIVRKGYFPETAKDIEDNFCFVNIDVNLYVPIYEGLKYFYPRTVDGGYIFVHDYNNKGNGGVKSAVRQYCKESGISYFPLSDMGGSVIIAK